MYIFTTIENRSLKKKDENQKFIQKSYLATNL